nr:hypothetical protein [uncultured Flavobacterium sp.]
MAIKISEVLKETLITQPAIQTVWLNDKGAWAFHKREGFDNEMSREDILEPKKAAAEKAAAEKK